MLTVRNIFSGRSGAYGTVKPMSSVWDVVTTMNAMNQPMAVVVDDDDQFLGIITLNDTSQKVLLKGKDCKSITAVDVMSSTIPYVDMDSSLDDCLELMCNYNITSIPVVDGNKFRGVLTLKDAVQSTMRTQPREYNRVVWAY